MGTLLRKEIIQFLGSLTGYLAIVIFLMVSGLFLWVFPGDYNITEGGYATLEPFFQLAPWLYLFLIPAITMRLFAEERRTGTLELLLTRPISDFRLVTAKYLAALLVVALTLLPTLLWFWSVYRLGNPVGNIDAGSTWGAFIGLFLLASIYIAIGLFASVLTDSQIVAFLLAVALSFLFYLGFGLVSGSGVPYGVGKFLAGLTIREHYLAVSRGVLDLSDLVWYAAMTLLFLLLTSIFVRRTRFSTLKTGQREILPLVGLLLLLLLADTLPYRIDLTSDKRYTLSPLTKRVAAEIGEPVTVELFLAGELSPGFRKLQQSISGKVEDMARHAGRPIRLVITDPYEAVPAGQREKFFEELTGRGIRPTDVRRKTDQGTETSLLFPGALLRMGERETYVNFLKNNPGLNHEVNLNQSVETVEYELVSALRRLSAKEKPLLVFLQGHGELDPYETEDLARSLAESFRVQYLTAGELAAADPDLLVIAAPEMPFSESDKFVTDQLLMKGKPQLWAIDPVEVSLDSLSQGFMTLAFPGDLHLNDQLFHYGVRVNSDLVQDVVCAQILVNTSPDAARPRFTPQNWYYSPLLTPSGHHPVSRNLNLLYSEFVSSIDTVGNSGERKSTVILSTSPYARSLRTPAEVSLESINRPPARELFNRQDIPAGVLIEGRFTSVFRNRILAPLGIPAGEVIAKSPDTKIMVFSDGSLLANKVRYQAGAAPQILPLGYDRVSQQTFGNKEFFVNALLYLSDREGILELRNTSVRLRLLDKVKLREQREILTWVNLLVPVMLVVVAGVGYNFLRRRKYAAKEA